jgi:hypothetical protein
LFIKSIQLPSTGASTSCAVGIRMVCKGKTRKGHLQQLTNTCLLRTAAICLIQGNHLHPILIPTAQLVDAPVEGSWILLMNKKPIYYNNQVIYEIESIIYAVINYRLKPD